jgi:hypothetical protein
LAAVRDRTTSTVTGNEMALLIKTMREGLFTNAQIVSIAIQQRNAVLDGLCPKLRKEIDQYK